MATHGQQQLFLDHNLIKFLISKLPCDIFSLQLVCKQWNNMFSKDDDLWRLLCVEKWPTLQLLSSFTLPQSKKEHLRDLESIITNYTWDYPDESDINEMLSEVARLPKKPLTPSSWKHLFQQRHYQSLLFTKDIARAAQQYIASRTTEDMNELLYWNERLRQTHGIRGFRGVTVENKQMQFIIDSLIYIYIRKKLIVRQSDSIEIYYSKVIYGTLMTLNGDTVTFSSNHHSEGDEPSRQHFSIGKFLIEEKDEKEKWGRWFSDVRELLNVNASLKEIWKLIKIIMVPVQRTDAPPDFIDENQHHLWGLYATVAELCEDEGILSNSNSKKRKEIT